MAATAGARRMIGRRWPVILAGLDTVVIGLFLAYLGNTPEAVLFGGLFGGSVVSFGLIGALLTMRVPGNRIGPILLTAATMLSLALAAGLYAVVSEDRFGGAWPGTSVAFLFSEIALIPPIVLVFMGVPLLFPDGRLLSPRWRWLVVLAIVAVAADVCASLFRAGPIGGTRHANPFGVAGLDPVLDALLGFANGTAVIGFGGAAWAVVVRYRRGTSVQRQQFKWLVAVASVGAVAFPVAFVVPTTDQEDAAFQLGDAAFIIGMATLLLLPVAIGVAILRYRLYDIDRIISRTLAYGMVTAVLIAVFGGLVLGLQAVLAPLTQESTIAVAASTLVVFALFQPLRRGVQRVVDRRFNRARIDAERTTEAFAGRLRDQLDLASLATDLRATAIQAVEPASATVWLHPRARNA